MKVPSAFIVLGFAAQILTVRASESHNVDPQIRVIWPVTGSVQPGGVTHFNYSVSYCPENTYIVFNLDEARVGGNDAIFLCHPFIWHGITSLEAGIHKGMITLHRFGSLDAIAHASIMFEIDPNPGRYAALDSMPQFAESVRARFFGVSRIALVDAAPTGAFIRYPKNHTAYALLPEQPVVFELVAMNFVPGKNGLHLRLISSAGTFEPDEQHRVHLNFSPGQHCLTAAVLRYLA